MGTPVASPAEMMVFISRAFAKLCRSPNEVEALIIPIRTIENVKDLQNILPCLPFYQPPAIDSDTLGTFATTKGANYAGSYSLYAIEVDYKLCSANELQLYLLAIRDGGAPAPAKYSPPDADAFSQHIAEMKARAEDCIETNAWLDIGGIYTGLDLLKFDDFRSYLGHLITSNAYMVYRCDFGLSLDY